MDHNISIVWFCCVCGAGCAPPLTWQQKLLILYQVISKCWLDSVTHRLWMMIIFIIKRWQIVCVRYHWSTGLWQPVRLLPQLSRVESSVSSSSQFTCDGENETCQSLLHRWWYASWTQHTAGLGRGWAKIIYKCLGLVVLCVVDWPGRFVPASVPHLVLLWSIVQVLADEGVYMQKKVGLQSHHLDALVRSGEVQS